LSTIFIRALSIATGRSPSVNVKIAVHVPRTSAEPGLPNARWFRRTLLSPPSGKTAGDDVDGVWTGYTLKRTNRTHLSSLS
jgi:hypothetical protein